ncbi:MAG: glycosyl hydrolase family 28 protein [Kiritimatiellae bacterium]|jgi:hypothetical protein|nr:glycosyl hydrolase family 28 protein [Kiritimatiellia bacterium]
MSKLVNYEWSKFLKASESYSLKVNEKNIFVHTTPLVDFATFSCEGEIEIEVISAVLISDAKVQPASQGIEYSIDGKSLKFSISKPSHLMVTIEGLPELFIYANPLEVDVPDENDENVTFFKAGQVYDVGRLTIDDKDNQTIYVEGGAVLKDGFNALRCNKITLRGRGIFDSSFVKGRDYRQLVFEGCKDVTIEGVVSIGPPAWNTVLGMCDGVYVDNLKTIGWKVCSDALDIVGSKNVVAANCFLCGNDDCVAIKSVSYSNGDGSTPRIDWRGDVENVEVRDCVMYNAHAGNVMEIGFETQTESIKNISFKNIDVLCCHGHGGVFTIHNGDRAVIEDILYEDIRVEHYFDKLVDFRIMHSRYSVDKTRGSIKNIKLKNIFCIPNIYNSLSLFGGQGDLDGVKFENFYFGEEKVKSLAQLNGFAYNAENITFE